MSLPLQIRARYSREEAVLWNWYLRRFPSRPEWTGWVAEAVGELLQTPAGIEARVLVSSGFDKQTAIYPISRKEIFIGREPENDIVLASQAITKRHARLWEEGGELYIEDLGSAGGIFAGEQKLAPKQAHAVADRERFTLFPYTLTIEKRRLWQPESRVEISRPEVRSARWREFHGALPGMVSFPLAMDPFGTAAVLEVSREFLAGAVRRALPPRPTQADGAGMLPYDRGLLESLLLAVLERVNRELAFPFRVSPGPAEGGATMREDEAGIAAVFLVRLSGLAGAWRVFMPDSLLAEAKQEYQAAPVGPWAGVVSWRCPLVAGEVELRPVEVAALEPGDVALLSPLAEVRLPGRPPRGWSGAWSEPGFRTLTLARYFERKIIMPNEQVDLSALPVVLHVIVGEKELTLADLNGLAAGSILELDRDKSAAVSLALNGRLAGTGELVEVDGRLGVRIVSWSAKP